VRFVLECPSGSGPSDLAAEGACAEVQLGDGARFYPSDAALARWRAHADQGRAVVAYE
jgi:DNA polymerase III subunit alpha